MQINDLSKMISGFDPDSEVMSESTFSKIDEYIPTGNYTLNACISGSLFGGMPNNRSMAYAGPSGVGKTFLTLNGVREAQKMGYTPIYCDSENAVDVDLMKKFGINTENVIYKPTSTVKEWRNFVANLCDKMSAIKKDKPKLLMVLDSMGNLSTDKEQADAISGNDKRDMTRASDLKSAFRIATMGLAKHKIPLICTNHTYMSIGGYIPTQTFSGGTGGIYNLSIILMLNKAGLKEDGTNKSGIIVTIKPDKNRFAKPTTIKIHISFERGMNPYVGLQEFMSWEACGVDRGTYEEEILEQPVLNEDGTPVIYRGKPKVEKINTGNFVFKKDDKSKYIAVRHLGKHISAKELFTPQVWTEEVLRELDKNVIGPLFKYPDIDPLASQNFDVVEDFDGPQSDEE